jgi:hypothetical protein
MKSLKPTVPHYGTTQQNKEGSMNCIETDCTWEHDGKKFTSGGSWIIQNPDTGKHFGLVYADDVKGVVTDWHGRVSVPARFGRVFHGNFGDRRRSVTFTYQGIKFQGIWAGMDYNQSVRVREVKP